MLIREVARKQIRVSAAEIYRAESVKTISKKSLNKSGLYYVLTEKR